MAPTEQPSRSWIDFFDDEDRAFVKRFILASGSLKEMARVYGVSYPTVRLRLDRLIAKINVVDDQQVTSDFERLVRTLYADGRIDLETLKLLLDQYRTEQETSHE